MLTSHAHKSSGKGDLCRACEIFSKNMVQETVFFFAQNATDCSFILCIYRKMQLSLSHSPKCQHVRTVTHKHVCDYCGLGAELLNIFLLKYTKILELNLFAFAYRLCPEDFSSIIQFPIHHIPRDMLHITTVITNHTTQNIYPCLHVINYTSLLSLAFEVSTCLSNLRGSCCQPPVDMLLYF